MSKLNLIAIVTIIAAVSLIVGMAAPAFAQGSTNNFSAATAGNSSFAAAGGAANSSAPLGNAANSSMAMNNSSMMMANSTK
ncbi:MAG: hypothetical protein ABJB76_03190 [Candidatus Nitrosocosmicus sp.]